MGALEIRRSSAQLNNLGSFRMPELDNGSARAWDAHARAARTAMDATASAGRATVEAISKRGQIVANALGKIGETGLKLADIALDLQRREDERIADEAYLQLKKETTTKLYGDENGNGGCLSEKPTDVRAWMQSVKDWNDQTVGSLTEKMNPAAKRLFEKKIASQQIGLQSTVAQHAAQYTMAREKTTALAMSKDALDTAKLQFGNPALRDTAIRNYVDAKNHEFEILGVPEEARAPLMRTAMRDLVSGGWDATLTQWSAEISAEQAPEKVKAAWDAKRAEAEKAGYTLNCAAISSHMPDGLTDAEKAMFRQRVDDAAKRSIGLAYQKRSLEAREATDNANRAIIDLYSSKDMPSLDPNDPNSVQAHYGYISLGLAKIGTDPKFKELNPSMARSLVEAANSLETQMSAKTATITDAEADGAYKNDYDPDTFGYYVPGQGFHKMTTGEAVQRATDAFNARQISKERWEYCMDACTKHQECDDQNFLDRACELVDMSCPGAFTHDRNGDFRVRTSALPAEQKKLGQRASTGITRKVENTGWLDLRRDETESVTYGQFARALGYFRKQILRDEKAGRRKSDDEYLAKFRELVKPTVEAWQKQKLEDTLEMIDTSFRSGEDWMVRMPMPKEN